jgi:hypothetical protein
MYIIPFPLAGAVADIAIVIPEVRMAAGAFAAGAGIGETGFLGLVRFPAFGPERSYLVRGDLQDHP